MQFYIKSTNIKVVSALK